MTSDAGTGGSTDIDAEVEAVGTVEGLKSPLGALRKIDEFVSRFGVE